jgi:hypothetical protein
LMSVAEVVGEEGDSRENVMRGGNALWYCAAARRFCRTVMRGGGTVRKGARQGTRRGEESRGGCCSGRCKQRWPGVLALRQ